MPCNKSWEEMTGNDEVRFCSHCAKDVHNISAMTRSKAARFVKKANGKLCVRYARNSNGEVITAPARFTQIKRRATIAAGVLSASLTLSTISHAQSEAAPPKDKANQTQTDKANKSETKQDVFTISGTIKDYLRGGVIPNATMSLRNKETGVIRYTQGNDDGFYIYREVPSGIYEIKVEASVYKVAIEEITVLENVKTDFDLMEATSVGLVSVEPKQSKISKIIKAPVRLFKKIF